MPNPFEIEFVLIGVVLFFVGLPLARKKVGRNRTYGFRTPKTLSNDELWYKANETAGYGFMASGAIVAVAALALTSLPVTAYGIVLTTLLLVCLFACVGITYFKDLRGK
jgi:uncharacterized membrane protein